MKNKNNTPTSSNNNASFLGEVIKLGIDVHKDTYVVVEKVDSSLPERPRRFKPEQFLIWVEALRERCQSLYSCYEAGAFGYVLHRKLEALGVVNHVICPINWDEHHKGVKTDGRDATQMTLALDGYLRGNNRSFSVVRVPSEQEEQLRSVTRQRQCLIKERNRNTNRGRSHALYYGVSLKGIWWAPRKWEELTCTLSAHLLKLLQPIRAIILVIN
jgi:transposase